MLKNILKGAGALVLAFIAYLFFQAGASENTDSGILGVHPLAAAEEPLTVAFGSCNRVTLPQSYWPVIARSEPDAWLWLGDNVYADTGDQDELRAAFQRQKNAPEYAAFAASVKHLYGVYDDHDYGLNDGGKEWEHKDMAKEELLDFLDVPADAPVRQRPGAYQSYTLEEKGMRVKIILLDTRYFRDKTVPATKKGHRYGQNPEGDVLGEAQWKWLEAELDGSLADAHLIASSYQVLPREHGYEKWDLFPAARERLLRLLAKTRPALPLLLSGDRHLAEISRVEVDGMPIYEITASGLTHSYEGADEPNQHRISPLIGVKNFGVLHFLPTGEGIKMLAEVRSIEDDIILASLALNGASETLNKEELIAIIHPKEAMPDRLKECPKSPNCVSTQTDQAAKQREPIRYEGTAAEAIAKLKKVVDGMARTKLRSESDNYLHYTFKTFPIPFIDDVEFLLDEEAKLIHYRSASRVGHSDLGVNSRRMEKVVRAFYAQ